MVDLSDIMHRLARQDCVLAQNHLRQAASALDRGDWESASAQVRSAVEALFDRVAEIRIATTKKGGAARKDLEAKGVLSALQARFVQSFMDYAGAGGSHAGTSTEEEARGRYLAGLGLVFIGLHLLPDLIRVEDVLAQLDHPVSEDEVTTGCPTCGTQQPLTECEVRRDGADTVYFCRNGCQALVVVSAPRPWPGRGFRIGNHVIRNAGAIVLNIEGAAKVLMPASRSALMKSRPGTVGSQ